MTLGDTLGNAQALVDTVADTVPEMEEYPIFEKRGGAQALLDPWAEKVAELEAVTPGDTLGDVHAQNDLLGDSWRHTGQCTDSGRPTG